MRQIFLCSIFAFYEANFFLQINGHTFLPHLQMDHLYLFKVK